MAVNGGYVQWEISVHGRNVVGGLIIKVWLHFVLYLLKPFALSSAS
jgi:hypothetical protein